MKHTWPRPTLTTWHMGYIRNDQSVSEGCFALDTNTVAAKAIGVQNIVMIDSQIGRLTTS